MASNNTKQEWVSVEPVVWKPKRPGDSVAGVVIAKEESAGKFGSDAYFIESDGQSFVIFGSTVLDRLMKLVAIGETVRVVFTETEESEKGNDTKLFQVFKRKANPSSGSQRGEEQ